MRLNKLCNIEDWLLPQLRDAIRLLEPDHVQHVPDYPEGREHRKGWEWAHLLVGLDALDAIKPDGMALGVAAGNEPPLFELTKRMRWVFATDIYGTGEFASDTAQPSMLRDPDRFARGPYNRNRLVVQYMDARDLRYEDNTFDVVFSLSSIEHFGGIEGAHKGFAEMARVLNPGGVLGITTECIVSGHPHYTATPNLELFDRNTLTDLLHSCPALTPVEEFDYSISGRTLSTAMSLVKALEDARCGRGDFPHIVLELDGRLYTSAAAFLRKTSYGMRDPKSVTGLRY